MPPETVSRSEFGLSAERQSSLRILKGSWDHAPRKTFALFSGGNDSAVLVHWAQPWIDAAVYIDTGTALPGVREFVERFTTRYEIPLLVYEAGDAYERLVLDCGPGMDRPLGFPGPGKHIYPYTALKERQVEALVRDHKEEWKDRIALLTGVRAAESRRRMGKMSPVERKGAQVWVAPLLHWSDKAMRDYREKFNLPESDVAALLHRSGECNCGAFARDGEREMIASLYPEFERWIADLERRAVEAGAINCRWGKRPPPSVHRDQAALVGWDWDTPSMSEVERAAEEARRIRDGLELAPGPLCAGCKVG